VYSLIPDLFPHKSRPRANIICYGASALGAGFGFVFGGALLSVVDDLRRLLPPSLNELETWRLVFILVALPGPVVAVAVFLIGRTRHVVMTAQNPAPPIGPYMKQHGAMVAGVYGAIACFSFGLHIVASWLVIAL